MGGRGRLGEFELLVLLAVMHRKDDAYGVTIAAELEGRTGHAPSRGALYVTLKRLQEKGYVTSRLGRPETVRGGHRRRYYVPTPQGVAAAQASRRAMQLMWAGLEQELEGA
jgi:PadR family transcriptional regulator PadR